MNKMYFRLLGMLVALSFALMPNTQVQAQNESDTIFVYLSDGSLHAFPPMLVKSHRQTTKMFSITDIDGKEYRYDCTLVDSVSSIGPDSLPHFEQFKFNNKFNDQVYQDVVCDISADNVITGTVPCIGKWLTPSFPLYEKEAVVYANGVRQVSKESRLKFNRPITYTVTRPGYQILRAVSNVEEEDPEEPETPVNPDAEKEQVELTVDMLSTNAPSNFPDSEGLDKLLDNDPSTFFHSTWGDGPNEKLPLDQNTYIEVKLPEALHRLQFSYTNRPQGGYQVISMILQVSKDGNEWKNARSFSVAEDDLPQDAGQSYTSPVIDLDDDYGYLRFLETETAHKNYIVWAELSIYKVFDDKEPDESGETGEQGEVLPEDYTIKFVPFGTDYKVVITFPSDNMTHSPAIYITTDWGIPPYSKTDYMSATISIDGAGIFPDMEQTPVQIRGRGNSSWNTNAYTKNPYRLKFDSKVKPFGLTKAKSWVLLSNRQSGSMTSNAIGMKAAQLAGTAGANHIVPVDLYMNGTYWGSYNFTEKIGFSNNSIDVADETVAAMLELDSYFDEPHKFRSQYYNLPVNIKEPDFDDAESGTKLYQEDIERDFNEMMSMIYNKQDISSIVDVDTLASFLLVNELIMNFELMHPKSTYLYKANYKNGSKYMWGPVWDLDWSYGYEKAKTYFQFNASADFYTAVSMESNRFMRDLRNAGEPLDKAIYKAWTIFINRHLDELIDYCDDYYKFAKLTLEKNNQSGYSDYTNYATTTANAKKWLAQRAQYIYSTLTPYSFKLNDPEEWKDGYVAYTGEDGEEIGTGIDAASKPTLFDVYDMRGIQLKRGATYDTFRDGLAPGIYVVNGKKVLIR